MKDQNPVNRINQNNDQLESKPYSPDKIKKPEKLKSNERTNPNNKENSQKNEKLLKSKLIDDDVEHPEPLLSDNSEENFEKIKKNFYENKKKENLLIKEYNKELKIRNEEILQQKLKKAKDSLQLKENIGKVVLNSVFMNDKNLKKQHSQKSNLLIKPEKVVKNFILERSNDINTSKKSNLYNNEINNNNNNINGIMKNNYLNPFQKNNKQKLINNNRNVHKGGPIIKIPLNLTAKNKQTIKKINEIPQQQNSLIEKKQNEEESKLKHYYSYRMGMNKVPLKKITKIVPLNNNTYIDFENSKSTKEKIKQNTYNYIYKIENNRSKEIHQERSNNIALNNVVININYNTSIKNNSRNIIKKNISPKNAYNNKMFGNTQMAHSTSKSNITSLNDNQKDKLKRISIPLKASNNNKSRDMILYLNSNEKLNRYKTDAETNNSFKKNIIGNSVNKANDSCYDSEKENYMNNLNFDKCNKKTIEKGGKFNNISTTYVVFSKNSCSNKNLLQPSRTIENRNFSKKIITQNLSTMSLLQNPMNSVNSIIPVNQIFHQKIPVNQIKKIKVFRSQNDILCCKKNKNKTLSNENTINNSRNMNYINNFSFYGRNNLNSLNINKTHFNKNKRVNKPVIYKYNYGNNLWLDDSFFTCFNTSGYNY